MNSTGCMVQVHSLLLACGQYSRLTIPINHNFFAAFSTAAGEPTEVLHGDLKDKMTKGDAATVAATEKIAELTVIGKQAIESSDLDLLVELIDPNFDLRRQVCGLSPFHVRMIETTRIAGASAKYCGSGGAIVATYTTPEVFTLLQEQLRSIGCTVFRPAFVEPR